MDQTTWAKLNDFQRSQYANWDNGQRRIPIEAATVLCERYGVTLDWIYRGSLAGVAPKVREKYGLSEDAIATLSLNPAREPDTAASPSPLRPPGRRG